ncbi:MAG: DNA primase [Actinobacteria bacterium 13_1_40CM_2_66_13]|nr:MAG: DNA primase [Chloroflexi bacterium 13_1_40CM_66_19]OLD06199.1 MAG: DNA primase [Actinobacteria bacterium 13_1_40CM_3_66_19]OLD53648.1 MAG: DNA primase [Actinobacteria bacterium 13_1_40CM_2_66_13]
MPVPTLSSDDAFAEVKGKVDLVKVVQEHVRLTKRNKDYWGLCPFHQEDSPSFHVNPQRQSWYCFGCERKGDVFTFVELIEKTDKRGALVLLAERAGVELKQLSPDQKDRADLRKRVLAMLKLAAQYYEYVLWKSPAGEPGRRLLESRRVGEETARRFQLGYAPAGRGFAEYLRAKKRSLVDAQEAGLMRRDGTDFFAERLVIPIRDERGQTLAFTARAVRADEPKKYINSPETPAYIKGRVVFGLDLARDEIARRGHAVMMEGQFDVITAHQFAVTNAVASSGTALTEEQVRLLKRFTDELLLVFDSDRAGRDASRKAAVLAAQHAMRSRVVAVPGAKDPDEFLRSAGPDAAARWEDLVAKAPSGFEAGMEEDSVGLNPSNPNQVERVAARLREWIRQFPATLREGYAETAERHTGISRHLLLEEPEAKPARVAQNGAPARKPARRVTASGYLLQLLAVRPSAFDRVRTKLTSQEFDEDDRPIYIRMLESYERGGPTGLEADLAGYPAEEQDLIRRAWAAPPPNVDDEVAVELAERIRLEHMKGMQNGIIRELSEAERGRDSERVAQLEAQARELGRAITDMERRS